MARGTYGGKVKKLCEMYYASNPLAKPKEVAKFVGCSTAYATIARKNFMERHYIVGVAIGRNSQNGEWLRNEAYKNKLKPTEVVDMLLTDARLDDEENNADKEP